MSDLCLITTCMGRLSSLRQALPLAVAQPGAACIVVDYSCPERCGEWVAQAYPQVTVVREEGQAQFQLARARNLGARAAAATWLCFFDADTLLDPAFSAAVLPLLKPRCFYRAEPWSKGLSGTVVCGRADFEQAGGYDEVIQGWGCEDDDLYARLRLRGVAAKGFPARLLGEVAHEDEMRVRHYDTKEVQVSHTINLLYMQAKLDLIKLTSRAPALNARRDLYQRVEASVKKGLQTNQDVHLQIEFRRHGTLLGWTGTGKLSYTLRCPRPTAPPTTKSAAAPQAEC